MMPDIFSSFDPFSYNTFILSNSLFLIINLILVLSIQMNFWLGPNQSIGGLNPLKSVIFTQLSRTFSLSVKGLTTVVSSIFVLIIFINLVGLFPYLFSTSSHLIFTLTLGLPIWMSLILSSFNYSPKKSVAHFLPDGAPDWLNPFLVLIETSSVLVRPLTLSFRLAANMSAGHIVLGLIGIYSSAAWFNSYSGILSLTTISMGYTLFEVAICLIQAYIFCLLLSLYSDDHPH